MQTEIKLYTIHDLINDYQYTGSGYFFSDSTMKAWKTKFVGNLKEANNAYYFITSDKFLGIRKYSIRKAEQYVNESGRRKWSIDTVMSYDSLREAKLAFKHLNKGV